MRPPKIHNLGPNSKEDSPHHVVVIDTETRWAPAGDGEIHRLRLWSAQAQYRHGHSPARARTARAEGLKAHEVAAWLDGQVKTTPPTWVYCHNLSFDLATTRLPILLTELGWTLTSHNLASDAPWAVMRKGRRTIRFADSHSLMPLPLAAIGAQIGMDKPPLPQDDDTDEAWFVRCRGDVEVTMAALLQLMDWWDQHALGHWSITGPRTGFNAMRHRCVPRPGYEPITQVVWGEGETGVIGDGRCVIDPDPEARAFERATLYQGRRDAWRIGRQPRGMYVELDMMRAHLTAARTRRLPCKRGSAFPSMDVDSPLVCGEHVSIIAEVELDSERAAYPVRTRAGIVHPVGRFRTVLAGPEIAEARDRGELVSIGRGYHYRMSWHMQPWATWAEDTLAETYEPTPAAAYIAVKGWTRSVPGTWAARTSRKVMEGASPVQGWLAEPVLVGAEGTAGTIVHMAGRMEMVIRDQEADDAFPAVLSFIQSYVRVALSRMIDKIPDYRLVSCSTDSILIDASGWYPWEKRTNRRWELVYKAGEQAEFLAKWLAPQSAPFTMLKKTVGADVRVLTPQHVRIDGDVRYSGVGRGADEVEKDKFRFMTWPKLGSQMGDGTSEGYVRNARTVDLSKVRVPRFAFDCGCTAAPRMARAESGNVITGPAWPVCPRHPAAVLQPEQHPAVSIR